MSIGSSPFQGGGSASIADATESTAGKIRIATTSESTTGTNDTTAMTPAKVKARIDAALVGGIDYKGTFNATTGLTNSGGNLNNAEQGDLYVIDTAGTIYGATWAVGDHLLINADMGGAISNSKIDKVDNTDLVTSVNGQTGAVNIYADDSTLNIAGTGLSISGSGATSTLNADSASESAAGIIEIATNAEATAGSATDKALVPSNLSSVGTSQFNNDAGFITSVASASESAAGIIEIATNAEATAGSATDKALVPSNLSSVGTSQLNNDAGFITSASIGNQITTVEQKTVDFTAVSNAIYFIASSLTVTLPSSSLSDGDLLGFTTRGTSTPTLTLSGALHTINNLQTSSTTVETNRRGLVWFSYDSGTSRWAQLNESTKLSSSTTAGIIEIATNAEATAGSATDKALVPSNLSSVGTSQLNNDAGFITSVASASDTTAGIIEIATNAEATAGSATDKALVPSNLSSVGTSQLNNDAGFITSVASASDTTAGIIEIATNAEATAGSATDKALVPSNLSSVGTSQLNNDAGFITSVASASDTTAGIIEIATNAEATAGSATDKALVPSNLSSVGTSQLNNDAGFITSVIDDTTPQLGGNLDLNGQDIVTTSNANLELAPDGTGVVSIKGNTTGGNNQGALKLNCEQNSHFIQIKSPSHSSLSSGGSYELVLPTGVGTPGQVLKTDGGDSGTPKSVQLAWVDQASGGGTIPDVVVTGNAGNVSAAFASAGNNGENERVYLINNSSTARTVTLPATSGNSGKKLQVKRLGTANVTIAVQSGETLETTTDGTFILSAQFSSVTLVCNASGSLDGWYII